MVARLAEAPPPQAVLSPLAMAPLLSAVGNVESAVARLDDPSADIVGAVTRLEAGIDALAAALEGDRAAQSDELQQGLEALAAQVRRLAQARNPAARDQQPFEAGPPDPFELDRSEPDERALVALHDRLDQVHRQLATLVDADLSAVLPSLADQGRWLERSVGDILLGLATVADHLGGQVVDDVGASAADKLLVFRPRAPDDGSPPAGLGQVAAQLDALVAAARADRQRFQRLGGSIDGLAELLGVVTERLDRPWPAPRGTRSLDPARPRRRRSTPSPDVGRRRR